MKRANGEGSITNLDGTAKAKCRNWSLRVTKGGKRRTRRFHGTYTQAEKALERFKEDLESEGRFSDLTFAEYADIWLSRRRRGGELAEATIYKDETYIKRLCAVFGDEPMAKMTRLGILDGLLGVKEDVRPGKPLSGTTMNKIFVLMKQMMTQAKLDGVIAENPMDALKAPRRDTKEKKALTMEEARRFAELLEQQPIDAHTVAVRLAVMAGLRRAEIVGLEWRDVRGGMLHVSRSVAERTGEVKKPKSAAGIRSVPMMPQLESALEVWRLVQADKLTYIGKAQAAETPIVTGDNGNRMAAQNLYRWWRSNRETFGVSCNLHELRHTYLTMMANSGAPAQVLKSVAGWSSIEMANTYVHSDEDANREAVAAMAARFGGDTNGLVSGATDGLQRNATRRNAENGLDAEFAHVTQR